VKGKTSVVFTGSEFDEALFARDLAYKLNFDGYGLQHIRDEIENQLPEFKRKREIKEREIERKAQKAQREQNK
jgi:hypothetical protein